MGMIQKYSNEQLIDLIIDLSKKLDRSPVARDLIGLEGYPGYNTFIRRFGSWNKTLELANLKITREIDISTDKLLQSLIDYYKKYKEPPLLDECSNFSELYGSNTYRRRFGSWNKALELANIPITDRTISHKETQWLTKLNILHRQYKINNYIVDGYDPLTNTVYEFLGDYWHGNPKIFDNDKYNKSCNKTFGELYEQTLNRLEDIKSLGYNIITIWESEYDKNFSQGTSNNSQNL